ncbi:hypothetical protein D3C87_269320 [compost metagenome]
MKKLLTFILTLSLNVSLAQETVPFGERFYLELNAGVGIYNASLKSYKYTNSSYSYHQYDYLYGYPNPIIYTPKQAAYIAGSVSAFYKYRWIKAGLYYQSGWPQYEKLQHSINVGGGFNTLGGLKKSMVWLGPFISVGGIAPFNGVSYIGSYRMDLGLDLYISNFHVGYRHSWWDKARSSDLSNMKINYLEIGYAIPLSKRESQKRWPPSDTLPAKKRFFMELDGIVGISQSYTYNHTSSTIYGLSLAMMYRSRLLKVALVHENINLLQNSLLFEMGCNTLAKVRNKKWWFGPVFSGGSTIINDHDFNFELRIGGGMDLYFKNFHIGYRCMSILSYDWDNYVKFGYSIPFSKTKKHD